MTLNQPIKRVWFDTDIGTDPSCATALLFALKHPRIEVVGVSISGRQQQRRLDEAYAVLEYADAKNVPVFLGENVSALSIDAARPDATITTGPLTNIARLVLDEASFGRIHIAGGAFRAVDYRGQSITVEKNVSTDKDATRIVLSQYDDICISSFEASSALVLNYEARTQIEDKHPFLKNRYDGFIEYLADRYGNDHCELLMNAVLPLCDILNTATITREVIEFYIQPDGSFRRAYVLAHRPPSIPEITDNPDRVPVPLVKHEVLRAVEPSHVLGELVATLT